MQSLTFDAPATALAFDLTARRLAVAFGDGSVRLIDPAAFDRFRRVNAHDGAVLHLCVAEGGFVTGGDDGRVVRLSVDGTAVPVHRADGWIDALAAASDGRLAFGSGKRIVRTKGNGPADNTPLPSTVGALAFSPDGTRLAAAHYGGVTLLPEGTGDAERLEWRGSHIEVAWSPDGAHVVAAAQEPELHLWRLSDRASMQLSGYGGKVRSLSWGKGGKYLATSGADGLVLWPFVGTGPFGCAPIEIAPSRGVLASAVACHPDTSLFAIGYRDGAVHLTRFDDETPAELLPPDGEPIAALAWSADGRWLAAAGESGRVGLHRRPGVLWRLFHPGAERRE